MSQPSNLERWFNDNAWKIALGMAIAGALFGLSFAVMSFLALLKFVLS